MCYLDFHATFTTFILRRAHRGYSITGHNVECSILAENHTREEILLNTEHLPFRFCHKNASEYLFAPHAVDSRIKVLCAPEFTQSLQERLWKSLKAAVRKVMS